MPAAAAGPYPVDMCVGTRSGNLACAANDVAIAQVEVTNGVTTCVAGTVVNVGVRVSLQSNASSRYDIGVFLARDGKPAEIPVASGGSASCAVFGLPFAPPPLADLNGNACGDLQSSSTLAVVDLGIVSLLCVPDQDGNLKLPATVTWEQNASGTCQAPPAAWVEAGSPSKCNASAGVDIPLSVVGTLTIVKRTQPAATPGNFAFTATGATPAAFSLADGQQRVLATGPLGTTPTAVTVAEAALPGFDPTADIVCTTADGGPANVTIDKANRTVTASLDAANSRTTCTFTNKAESQIRVVKNSAGGDDTFPFVGAGRDFSITTAGGTGQFLISGLSAGVHSVTELVPAGWTLTNLACADPSGGTTVDLAGKRADVGLAVGETVTCTFTDTRNVPPATGVINILKTTAGGDDAFGFTTTIGGARIFTLQTSGGTSPARSFTGLPAGVYSVTELVPAPWALASISCVDPTANSSGAGATATIDLAAGETVTCTFHNRLPASVVVEKVAVGGDATFNFTGTAPFAIATSSGFGRDTATFASVPGGSPITIAETVPAGWALSGAACRDAQSGASVGSPVPNGRAFTPVAGQQVICTFTNQRLAQLTIVEVSSPKSPQAFAYAKAGTGLADFTLADNGGGGNAQAFANLAPGQAYSVTQGAVAGWNLTRIICSDRNAAAPTDRSVVDLANGRVFPSLQPGENLVCAFFNTQPSAGAITVNKLAAGGDDTFAFANSGGVPASPTNPDAFTIATTAGSGSRALTALAAGTYTISETVPAGWLSLPSVQCAVLSGSNTTFAPAANGVTVNLGVTGLAVDAVACDFDNTKAARITIVEDALPDGAQAFGYAGVGTGVPAAFALVNDGTPPPADRATFAGLTAGAYRFTASTPAGWRLIAILCTGSAGWTVDLAAGRADGTLAPGDDVTCTFRHAREATLSVTKSAPAATPEDAFAFDGPAGIAGDYAAGQTRTVAILPGAYAVTELVPDGWSLTNIACAGGTVTYTGATVAPSNAFEAGDHTANILALAGDAVACTFTNAPTAAAIIVRKQAVGGDGIFAFTGVEDFQIDTRLRMLPVRPIFVGAGTHTVTEIVPPGWRLTGLACGGTSTVNPATATATVTVAAGERVLCTFTNERLGRIEIVKALGGERTTAFSFSVPPTLDPALNFTLTPPVGTGTASRVFENVPAGTYLVGENGPPAGFNLRSIACVDPSGGTVTNPPGGTASIALAAGETVTCTFTNVTLGSITVGAVSAFGLDTFGFQATSFPAAGAFTVTTSSVTTEVGFGSRSFGDLPPAIYTVTADPAPAGWRFLYLTCVSDSGEQHWAVAGRTAIIRLPDGENVRCYYAFAQAQGGGGSAFAVPVLTPLMSLVLAALLVAGAWFARRR